MKNKLLTLDILNYKFKVVIDPDIQRRGRDGECDIEGEVMRIGTNLTARNLADTILHEILHAIVEIGLDSANKLNELQINYLGAMLTEVLRRNPSLKPILMP